MRIMTVTALHDSFEHLVMEGLVEVGLNFTMAADTELRLAERQHVKAREVLLFSAGSSDKRYGLRNVSIDPRLVW
jgi:hypothetical protein